jgi:hypothetical protein
LRLVVDASTLVGELLRERGLKLIASPYLDLYVPARMWEETRHEVSRRLEIRVSKGLPEPAASQKRVATWTVDTLIAQLERRGQSPFS